jgi:hypothetical protein
MWNSAVTLGNMPDARRQLETIAAVGKELPENERADRQQNPIPHNPCAEVAQLVEHSPEKAGVDSSILSLGTTTPIT